MVLPSISRSRVNEYQILNEYVKKRTFGIVEMWAVRNATITTRRSSGFRGSYVILYYIIITYYCSERKNKTKCHGGKQKIFKNKTALASHTAGTCLDDIVYLQNLE